MISTGQGREDGAVCLEWERRGGKWLNVELDGNVVAEIDELNAG